jgi:hypothetical protein
MSDRRREWCLLCSLVLIPAVLQAQTIRGRLIDAASRAPVLGGRVEVIDASDRVVVSGLSSGSGAFNLVVPAGGRYRYRVTALGYSPKALSEIVIDRGDDILGDVPLTRTTQHLPDLVTTARATLTWTSHYYRLWDAVSGKVNAVVAYAVHYRNLVASRSGPPGTAPVDLALHQRRGATSRPDDTTIVIAVQLPADNTSDGVQNGLFVVPSAGDVAEWTLIVTQPEYPDGGDWEYARSPLSTGLLALSDLVLGSEDDHVAWDNHGDRVVLASKEPIDARGPIELYYQMKSTRGAADVHSDIAVYHTDKSVKNPVPVARLTSDGAVAAGVTSVHRTLDLSAVEQGRYRIEVQAVDRTTGVAVQQSVTFYLQ